MKREDPKDKKPDDEDPLLPLCALHAEQEGKDAEQEGKDAEIGFYCPPAECHYCGERQLPAEERLR